MNWKSTVREAAQAGNYGRVIELIRRDSGLSQAGLGEACGLSQSAISRLEKRGVKSYETATLARVASYLRIPPQLVGLADRAAMLIASTDGPMERRNSLDGAAVVSALPARPSSPDHFTHDAGQAGILRLATGAFRRLDGSTPARQLIEPVLAQLRLTQTLAVEVQDQEERSRLAAAGSEIASFAGWLSWDMGDLGSARTWYGASVKSARRAGHPLLTAYQLGSLAQLEAHVGNTPIGLSFARSARKVLGHQASAIADAWLASVEAVCYAATGDESAADERLVSALRAVERMGAEASPPWPWVFNFTESKVAVARVACGARLGRPEWINGAQHAAASALASGNDKQRALLTLDIAQGHLAAGRLDGAFALAARALDIGLRYRSGRIVDRARSLRREYSNSRALPRVVREFDERLCGVFL
ncbi:helix-turn-helix domain-containing protein [Streptomyces tsukubensis]